MSQRGVVLLYYALSACFGLLALVLPSPSQKLLVLLALGGLVLAVLVALSLGSERNGREGEAG